MGFTNDEHTVRIKGSEVTVTGDTGLVEATWSLRVDGEEMERKKASGTFELHGRLPDGDPVVAHVQQGAFGPTEVAVLHDGAEVVRFKGFVA
jgi:hypothetical protein